MLDDELEGAALRPNRAEAFELIPRSHSRKWRQIGTLLVLAAVVALASFFVQPWSQNSTPGMEIATRAGEQRSISLTDGSSIVLNGSSRVRLSGADAREAELISGEALFRIRHNASRPFLVGLGDDRIQDLGTVFNVVRDGDSIGVQVADGAVSYSRGGQGIQMREGQTLEILAGGDALIGHKAPSAIGSWSGGQLIYEGVPVADVARDLSRTLGARIAVSPELALQPFTGIIRTRGSREQVIADFSSTLARHARKTEDGWLIR
jgi:transmembrane sensor